MKKKTNEMLVTGMQIMKSVIIITTTCYLAFHMYVTQHKLNNQI